jgi:membrane protein implicated in regulation of membrane protease activity
MHGEVRNMPAITDYVWIAWLVFILIFVIIELLTLDFTFLMLSVGSLGGLGANALGLDWWLQIVVAGALSLVLILLIRPPLLRALRRGGDPTPTNVAALIGIGGRVLSSIGENGGLVKLANGETWTARVADSARYPAAAEGESVVVTAIEGSTAVVIPSGRTVS